MIKTSFFLIKNRSQKKWLLNKKFFHLSFDFTSLFYTFLVIGYFIVAIFLEGNISQRFNETLLQMEAFTIARFWQIATILPLFYLLRAFQQPGVVFSTAEYLLTILPNRRGQVWFVTAIIRWMKALLVFSIGGLVLFLFSPTSFSLIITYVCLLLFMNILMTIPEWKFFQMHILKKIAMICLILFVNILYLYFPFKIIGITVITLFILYNIISIRSLFTNVDWKKVTIASDFKLWNMLINPIISRTSKIKFKKEKQYSLWQRLSFWRKPFRYEKKVAYHRLWHLYFEKNIGTVLQLIGALLLLLFVFAFIKETLFLFAVAITIHIFTSFISSMFQNRLVTDVVEVLPWDLSVFKKTLIKWASISSLIFLIPYFVYAYDNFTFWLILQLIVIIFTFAFMMEMKLRKVMAFIESNRETKESFEIASYLLLIAIIFSHAYPILLILCCLIIVVTLFLLDTKRLRNNRDTHLS